MRRSFQTKARLVLTLALALSLMIAGSARARGLMQFGFRAGHGYRIEVAAQRSTVSLTVQRHEPNRHARAFTTYYTRVKPSDTRIQASFGALGVVSMRFKPSGRIVRGGGDCSMTNRDRIRYGAFVGTLEFRGEGGYLSTRIHRAKGRLIIAARRACRDDFAAPIPIQADRHPRRTILDTGFREGVRAVYFGASSRAQRTRYSAIAESVEGRVATYRFAYVEASPLTFVTDNALSFASLSPPYPFSGTGSLQRNPNGSRTWTGSLAVSFPGAPDLPLTGPQYRTRLTRSW